MVSDHVIAIGQAKFLFLVLGLPEVQEDPDRTARRLASNGTEDLQGYGFTGGLKRIVFIFFLKSDRQANLK